MAEDARALRKRRILEGGQSRLEKLQQTMKEAVSSGTVDGCFPSEDTPGERTPLPATQDESSGSLASDVVKTGHNDDDDGGAVVEGNTDGLPSASSPVLSLPDPASRLKPYLLARIALLIVFFAAGQASVHSP